MKVLVTGADGLLGSSLVRELLEQGHSTRALVQPASKSPTLQGLALERIYANLPEDEAALGAAITGCDGVFHCAAITNQWAPAELTWRINYEGTQKVMDACLQARASKLVFVGSASSFQFGPLDRPGDESGGFPREYRGMGYMESKHKAMGLVLDYVRQKGLNAVVVCPTFMIGPYDAGPSSGELIRQFISRGLRVATAGGRNFAHPRDVARAMVAALERGRSGECYILGGVNLTYMDFFTKVAKVAGLTPPRLVLPRAVVLAGGTAGSLYERISGKRALINLSLARLSLLGTYYSPAKAIKELGLAQTPIETAIEESIRSLKEYRQL
ncbi:MAG TPA: NAD-dependent epimerase/dehydratase family protein [bacterium]|nr:NAD-dependent epimerase/dehydratase family protein [bacterium]